jgi:hypothetical protein
MPAGVPPGRARRAVLASLGVLLALSIVVPSQVAAAETWTKNLYNSRGYLTQDPYMSSCVGASVMMMLNFTRMSGTGGNGFVWQNSIIKNSSNPTFYRDLTSVQYYARKYDTLSYTGKGSDAHGWRNALNAYGWGSAAIRDPDNRVYEDLQFTSFADAVKTAAAAIARYDKPVGILGDAGEHAQIMTGYVAVGEDPAESDDFTVTHIYLTDPLNSAYIRNKLYTVTSFEAGSLKIRFRSYRETDSPKDDGYTSGWIYSSVARTRGPSEWYARWVIVAPVRRGLPEDA